MHLYENKIVCFLDILGFKGIINETQYDDAKLQQVQDALKFLENYKYETDSHNAYINNKDKLITQFSDSLIISFSINLEGQFISSLLEMLYIIINLINHGFLVRGGITYGKIVHIGNLVFGPAFIEAYELELSASTPRVILSFNILNQILSEEIRYTQKSFLAKDCDGYVYIDYFKTMDEHDSYYEYFRYLDILYRIIIQGLSYDKANIRAKYEWMRMKYNEVVYLLQNNDQSHLEDELMMNIAQLSHI